MKLAVLPGDGIGTEIVAQAVKVLDVLKGEGASIEMEYGNIGGIGYDKEGDPLPETTLKLFGWWSGVMRNPLAQTIHCWL